MKMKIRKSFEQAICILLLIGANDKPIKSHELSEKLSVSDSYLKKFTRQLVVSGLIQSMANKRGGFVLTRSLENISLLDIFEAMEGKEPFVKTTHLVDKVFDSHLKVKETEDFIVDYLNAAEYQYKQKLNEITLSQIINAAHQGGENL